MKKVNDIAATYPGFEKSITVIKKFKSSGDLFSIMLWDGSIIHHTDKHPTLFRKWLIDNHIEDIASHFII
jgi:hypothetical protein